MLRVMSAEAARFEERLFSRLFGKLLALGLGLPHKYQLEVRGRRSGRLHVFELTRATGAP